MVLCVLAVHVTTCAGAMAFMLCMQTVYINPLQTLQMFLKSAGERLGGVDAQRLFNSDGGEVDDLMLVDDGDILFVSAGEDFQAYPGDTGGNPSVGGVNGSQQGAGGAAKAGAANGKGRIDRIGGYRLTAYLGRGAYGKVYKGVHQLTEQPVAIKFISKMSMGNVADAERIATEIHCLETLQHRSVIKLHQVLNTDRAVALVFEYAGGGDLRQKVKACRRIPEPEAARLFANIMDGVMCVAARCGCCTALNVLTSVCLVLLLRPQILPSSAHCPPRPQTREHPAGRRGKREDRGLWAVPRVPARLYVHVHRRQPRVHSSGGAEGWCHGGPAT